MFVRIWKGTGLCKVLICRSGLPASDLTGEMGTLYRLMSAVSTKANVVAISSCSADLVRTIDGSQGIPYGRPMLFPLRAKVIGPDPP